MDPVTVITLADESYGMPLAVTVRSLLDNLAGGRDVRIVVIDGGILPDTKQQLVDSWRDAQAWGRCDLEYVSPRYDGIGNIPHRGRLPVLTYARLSAAEYVPGESGKVVFLDSDTLVLTDVSRLAAMDLGDATIAAAQDPYIPLVSSFGGLRNYTALGLSRDARYFNAGIMVIDIGRWRAEHVGPNAFAYTRRHLPVLQNYDQDSLNAVLAGRWKELDARWQVHPRTGNSVGRRPLEDAYIIHFSGRLKPWLYAGRTCADALFYEYVDRTAWRRARPPATLTSMAMRLYDSPVRRVLYPIEKRLLGRRDRSSRDARTVPEYQDATGSPSSGSTG